MTLRLPDEPELRDFLVRVDSYTSLVAYRHHRGGVPDDVVEELKKLSQEARKMYGGR